MELGKGRQIGRIVRNVQQPDHRQDRSDNDDNYIDLFKMLGTRCSIFKTRKISLKALVVVYWKATERRLITSQNENSDGTCKTRVLSLDGCL